MIFPGIAPTYVRRWPVCMRAGVWGNGVFEFLCGGICVV